MKLNGSLGTGVSIGLEGNHKVDIVVYEGKVFCEVTYDIWEQGNCKAIYYEKIRFFRWELLLGRRISNAISTHKLIKLYGNINKRLKEIGIDDYVVMNLK